MDNSHPLQEPQSKCYLSRKVFHYLWLEALELVLLNQFVEVQAEQLEYDDDLVAECECLFHSNYMPFVMLITPPYAVQQIDFYHSLSLELFPILYQF